MTGRVLAAVHDIAEAHIAYRAPAFFGEPVACECRGAWASRSAFGLEYRVVSDGGPLGPARLIADGSTVQVMYDLVANRVMRMPSELLERRPDAVVSADLSCLMHLGGLAEKAGRPVRTLHFAQVLRDALANANLLPVVVPS